MARKVIFSNRIYFTVEDGPEREAIKKKLTYKIPLPKGAIRPGGIPYRTIKTFGDHGKGLISVPSGRTDLIPKYTELKDNRVQKQLEDFPEFTGILRDSQQVVYDQVKDSCSINAPPAWGKTFMACAIAAKFKQKTLIILHNTFLRDQWSKEIEKVFGFKPGVIGSGRFKIDTPIVVGNIQTLHKRLPEIQAEFGLVILDEMHHVSSRTISGIIDAMQARYKIGLSATLIRKDGEHVVFPDYFGPDVYVASQENSMTPRVLVIETDMGFDYNCPTFADKVTELTSNPKYISLLSLLLNKLPKLGKSTLLALPRVELIRQLGEIHGNFGTIHSGTNGLDRENINLDIASGELDGLIATQSIVSEGYSNNILSAVILGTPINNDPLLEQIIGRVTREHDGKAEAWVVDLMLCCPTGRSQFKNRLNYYIKKGYDVQYLKPERL